MQLMSQGDAFAIGSLWPNTRHVSHDRKLVQRAAAFWQLLFQAGRAFCKLNWFLRDFGYDLDCSPRGPRLAPNQHAFRELHEEVLRRDGWLAVAAGHYVIFRFIICSRQVCSGDDAKENVIICDALSPT
jgi:hypothetical protein